MKDAKNVINDLISKDEKKANDAAKIFVNNLNSELVNLFWQKFQFWFDYLKNKLKKRLQNQINEKNIFSVFKLCKKHVFQADDFFYSLVEDFSQNEDVQNCFLKMLQDGSLDEKIFASKFFVFNRNKNALPFLKDNAFSENEYLSLNCACALNFMQDFEMRQQAVEMLDDKDDFQTLKGIKFLSATGYDECLEKMFEVLKRTAFKENVAIEISYCSNLLSLIEKGNKNALFCFNCIIDGLGEILSLSEVLNLDFLNILKYLYNNSYDMPEYAVVLLNCVAKFNLIFSNESYTFDENKETKIELEKIKFFLNNLDENFIEVLKEISLETLQEDNIFIFCALNIVREFNIDFAFNNLEVLLKTSNDILKYEIIDIIKEIGFLDKINAEKILSSISDKNLRVIIENVFNK